MKRHGVAASGAIGFVGAVASSVLAFVLIALVGHGGGVVDTGTFFQFVGWFMIAAALLRFGADTGLLRSMAQQSADQRIWDLRQSLRVALGPVVLLSVGVAVVVHLNARTLVLLSGTPDSATAEHIVKVLAWCLPPAVVLSVLMGGLRGLGSVVAFTVVQNIALPALRVALIGVVVALGVGGISGVLNAWAVPLPVLTVVGIVLMLRALREAARGTPADVSERLPTSVAAWNFWSFSSARGVAAFLETSLEWIDVLVVAAFRSPAEAGIYAVATRVARAGLVVETAVRIAVAPRVATLLGRGERKAASVLFTAMARAVILVSWPLFLVLIVFAPTVLGVFGHGFEAGATVLRMLAVAMMLRLAAGMVQSLLLMGGRSQYQMGNKIAAVVASLVLNVLLVPVFGIVGSAVAWVITTALDTALATLQVRRTMHIALRLRLLVLPAALTLVFAAGCLVARVLGTVSVPAVELGGWLPLTVAVVVNGVAYLGLLWALRRRMELVELLRL